MPHPAESARGSISLDPGSKYQLREICLHPSEVFVKGEPANKRQEAQFVAGKILTRYTSSLDQVYGDLSVAGDKLQFQELGGIDFQPSPAAARGEEVPFMFSSKELLAQADGAAITTSTDFSGSYRAPSYRTSNFLDPKARALTTGVDYAQGLVALASGFRPGPREHQALHRRHRHDGPLHHQGGRLHGEFAGVFTAIQPSDTDMGGKDPWT